MKKRLRDGADIVVVDPRRTELAAQADIFLQMVQQAYPPVYRHKSFEFGEARASGGRIAHSRSCAECTQYAIDRGNAGSEIRKRATPSLDTRPPDRLR